MKQNHLLGLISFLLFFLLSGCMKRTEYQVPCRILEITDVESYGPYQTLIAKFEYYPWGDPYRITSNHPGTGTPNYLFKYDKHHRLTDFTAYFPPSQYFPNGNYLYYAKYIYNNQNIIVKDSVFISGNDITNPGIDPYGTPYLTQDYYYDSKGRISKIASHVHPNNQLFETTYNYDTKGNLIRDYAVEYDDKVNIYRTNLIWMFVSRNYSVNNVKGNASYNALDLPISYLKVPGTFTPKFLQYTMNKVTYSCDKMKD